jgi:hypothetical protein
MAKILTLTLNPALDLTVELAQLAPGQVNRSDEMHTHAAGSVCCRSLRGMTRWWSPAVCRVALARSGCVS